MLGLWKGLPHSTHVRLLFPLGEVSTVILTQNCWNGLQGTSVWLSLLTFLHGGKGTVTGLKSFTRPSLSLCKTSTRPLSLPDILIATVQEENKWLAVVWRIGGTLSWVSHAPLSNPNKLLLHQVESGWNRFCIICHCPRCLSFPLGKAIQHRLVHTYVYIHPRCSFKILHDKGSPGIQLNKYMKLWCFLLACDWQDLNAVWILSFDYLFSFRIFPYPFSPQTPCFFHFSPPPFRVFFSP